MGGQRTKRDLTEQVDGPAHYGGSGSVYETIKVMTVWYGAARTADFCKLNAVKYLSRAGKKGDEVEDLAKARWYLDAAINLMQGKPVR